MAKQEISGEKKKTAKIQDFARKNKLTAEHLHSIITFALLNISLGH